MLKWLIITSLAVPVPGHHHVPPPPPPFTVRHHGRDSGVRLDTGIMLPFGLVYR